MDDSTFPVHKEKFYFQLQVTFIDKGTTENSLASLVPQVDYKTGIFFIRDYPFPEGRWNIFNMCTKTWATAPTSSSSVDAINEWFPNFVFIVGSPEELQELQTPVTHPQGWVSLGCGISFKTNCQSSSGNKFASQHY